VRLVSEDAWPDETMEGSTHETMEERTGHIS
jgi:hypothetical protein